MLEWLLNHLVKINIFLLEKMELLMELLKIFVQYLTLILN